MLAEQALRGGMHRVGVEMARHPPGAADVEREIGAVVGDAIEVVPLLGGEPRLEIIRHDLRAESTPIGCGRKCAFRPSRSRPGGKCFAMSQCATCASACTPASVRPAPWTRTVLAADRLHRGFQRALHGGAIVLDLPAGERRAVIFDDELVAGHQLSRAGGFSGVPRKNSAAFIGALPARCSSRIRIAPSPQAIAR